MKSPRLMRRSSLILILTLVGSAVCVPLVRAQSPGANAVTKDAFINGMQSGKLPCPLDALLKIPEVWNLTPAALDAAFAVPEGVEVEMNPFFTWLTKNKDRAAFTRQPFSNLELKMSLFGGELPVDEVIVDFAGGKLNAITFTLYDKGDSGKLEAAEFQSRLKLCGKKIGEALQSSPVAKKANPSQGLPAEGWSWASPRGLAALEYNPEAPKGAAEFLRLRVAPRDAKGLIAASLKGESTTAKMSDLQKNVSTEPDGGVVIKGLPMVDQGQKGYCAVASAQRLFEYYGISADQHQIAQAAETSSEEGTTTVAMSAALEKIDHRFKTRFKIIAMLTDIGLAEVDERKMTVGKNFDESRFNKEIRRFIDQGVPLLWSLELGKFPEDPPISKQATGGHMRMIIGYNEKSGTLLFSDSWGAGHELKKIAAKDAYAATTGLFVMLPTVQ